MLHLVRKRGDFQKLSHSSENLCITLEGLGELFEADFNDRCANFFFAGVDGGLSGGLCMRRTGSEDPHRRQRNFFLFHFFLKFSKKT